jgi:D-alanyl-D-alanine carboxypeptidase
VALAAAAALLVPIGVAEARYAAIVIEAQSGKVLFARQVDKRRYPASLTKMMTLFLTFEALEGGRLHLARKLKVSKRAAGQTPSRLGLRAGQTITVEQGILALVTKSANDAATVLAEAMGGTEAKFAQQMTNRARALGMRQTRFTNASGLHNRSQVTTARDMATLARVLQQNFPQYYHYFSTPSFTFKGQSYRNHNRLLGRYAGSDGIKTGYIRASGFNLAASVRRGPDHLIGVVFGGRSSRSRDNHMIKLLNQGFARLETERQVALRKAASEGRVAALPVPRPRLSAGPGTAPQVAAAEAPSEVGSASPERLWAVQVGAYRRLKSAEKRVERTARALPEALADAGVWILRYEDEGKNLYRARFVGFGEKEARRTCSQLKRKGISCLPISPRNDPAKVPATP